MTVGDVFIRNVPTDIRNFRYYGFGRGDLDLPMQKDGNSIFIFEVAGLCIGHLGHLHHKLDESHIAAIGRLDVADGADRRQRDDDDRRHGRDRQTAALLDRAADAPARHARCGDFVRPGARASSRST